MLVGLYYVKVMPGNRNEEIQVENTLPGGSFASFEIPISSA